MISCTKKIILRWTSGTMKFVNVRCALSPLPTIGWDQESHPLGHLTEKVPRAGCAMHAASEGSTGPGYVSRPPGQGVAFFVSGICTHHLPCVLTSRTWHSICEVRLMVL